MARIAALVLAATAFGLAAAPAIASSSQLSLMQDDHLLLYSGDAAREATLDQMQRLGVTTIRTLVIWNRLAPQPRSFQRPVFNATDPASYHGWAPYDALVQGALARGMTVLMTPTAPVPQWASQCGRHASRRWVCKPRASDYGNFVRAVAYRYSGSYTTNGVVLPRVSAWSVWNEPNHRLWLMPHDADRYRVLVTSALAALAATGHSKDLILIGETAPGGGSKSTAPVDFMRELFCLDGSYRPYTGRVARQHGCEHRPHFAITGIAHHPYTSNGIAPPSSFKGRSGDAPIASIGRLVAVLDRAAHYGIVPRRAPVYLTEFGFQTRPPDPFGLSLARQAEYLNESDYLAFLNPRVASVAQYELRDDVHVNVFNTGLLFKNGRPKPALAAYALPIWVAHGGPYVRVFGLVRNARGAPVQVTIQHRARAARTFRNVARATTNRWGYLLVRVRDLGGSWRLQVGSGASARYSRIAA